MDGEDDNTEVYRDINLVSLNIKKI